MPGDGPTRPSPSATYISQGIWLREQRRGRTGPDTPLVLFAGAKGFRLPPGRGLGDSPRVGRATSGTSCSASTRVPRVIGAGEIYGRRGGDPRPRRVSYNSLGLCRLFATTASTARRPECTRCCAGATGHPTKSRPVLLNTWEAVEFDSHTRNWPHLADAVAAEVGVERFVIDDGWFG